MVFDMDRNKETFRDAFEKIEFFSNSTWLNLPNIYQLTNQALLARKNMTQESLSSNVDFPRTVRDVIPKSRLAQYCNSVYNEERELLYTPHSPSLNFNHPYWFKNEMIEEPWMLPEIENLFAYFSSRPDLEACTDMDSNYNTSDCKPKRKATSDVSNAQLAVHDPTDYKPESFEEVILKIKIQSDNIKHLWCPYSQPNVKTKVEKKINMVKSPLGNSFFLDENHDVEVDTFVSSNCLMDEYHVKRNDFSQLQYLADFIRILKELSFNQDKQKIPTSLSETDISFEEPGTDPKTPAPSARRLYSAVLQGFGTDANKPDMSNCLEVSEQSFSIPINASENKLEENSCNSSDVVILTKTESAPIYTTAPSHGITNEFQSSNSSINVNQEQPSTSNCSRNICTLFKPLNTSSNSTLYPETSTNSVTNVFGVPANSHFCASPCSNHFSPLSINNDISNANYILNPPCPTNVYNNIYANPSLSYTNNAYAPNDAFQSNQIPHQVNHAYPANPMQAIWFLPQSSPLSHSSSSPHPYLTTPLLQQRTPEPLLRQNQRWQYPVSYMLPPNPYNVSLSPQYPTLTSQQQWVMQNQNFYRVNSNQQVDTNQRLELYTQNTSKMKFKTTNTNLSNTHFKFRNKSSEELHSNHFTNKRKVGYNLPSTEKQFFVKTAASTSSLECRRPQQHTDYKPKNEYYQIKKRASVSTLTNNSENFASCDSEESQTLLPIILSRSEDLERQALEQYQNSNENFYQELERQAEEQYDEDSSENWFCPPCKSLGNGGLQCIMYFFL